MPVGRAAAAGEAHHVTAECGVVAAAILEIVGLDAPLQLTDDAVLDLREGQIDVRRPAQRRRHAGDERWIERPVDDQVTQRDASAETELDVAAGGSRAVGERDVGGEPACREPQRVQIPAQIAERACRRR